MKVWEEDYNYNSIRVENDFSGERLFVNDELQDIRFGTASRSVLWGSLPTGEKIKVSLGGDLAVKCAVFINDRLLFSRQIKD